MTQNQLQINYPTLPDHQALRLPMTDAQIKSATIRIHQRFQGQLISILESSKMGNFRETKHPLEAGRPKWSSNPHGHHSFIDLILQKRGAEVVALLEVKTKRYRPQEFLSPNHILETVLDRMGAKLTQLQEEAQKHGLLWVVVVGAYQHDLGHMAEHFSAPFSVIMAWGRGVGPGSPRASYSWETLEHFDRDLRGAEDPLAFWQIASPIQSPPQIERPLEKAEPILNRLHNSTTEGLIQHEKLSYLHNLATEELIQHEELSLPYRVLLKAVLNWPSFPISFSTEMGKYYKKGAGATTLRTCAKELSALHILEGYKPKSQRLTLSINREALIRFLESQI